MSERTSCNYPSETVKPLNWSRRLALLPIRFYRLTLSWLLGRQCRFRPTCSAYAQEAIERHGAVRGWWLALRRLVRCHPFHPGGWDPVPPSSADKRSAPPSSR